MHSAHGRNTDKAFTPDDGGNLHSILGDGEVRELRMPGLLNILGNLGDGGNLLRNLGDDGNLLGNLGDGGSLLRNLGDDGNLPRDLGDGGSLVFNLLDGGDLLSILGKGEVRELGLLGLAVPIASWYPRQPLTVTS